MKTISLILISLVFSTVMFGSSFIIPTKPATVYNSIEDILKTIDPTILPHNPGQEFAEGVNVNGNYIEVLTQKAGDIRSYITSKYSEDFSDFSNSEIIALGIIMVPFESRDNNNNSQGRVSNSQAFGCMMTALGAATGIGALITAWNSGATASTILSTLRSILRIGYGWFAIGYAVFSFGECVGWW